MSTKAWCYYCSTDDWAILVNVIAYDGDKYCIVKRNNKRYLVKRGYLFSKRITDMKTLLRVDPIKIPEGINNLKLFNSLVPKCEKPMTRVKK